MTKDHNTEAFQEVKLLEDLLLLRDIKYAELTSVCINVFEKYLTDAIKKYLKYDCHMNWYSIENASNSNRYVRVAGICTPIIGAIFEGKEGKIEINEDNKKNFTRVVALMMPINLLNSGDSAKMLNFIYDISLVVGKMEPEDIQKLLDAYEVDENKNEPYIKLFNSYMDLLTKPKDVFGFDGTKMADETIKKLHTFVSCATETKN